MKNRTITHLITALFLILPLSVFTQTGRLILTFSGINNGCSVLPASAYASIPPYGQHFTPPPTHFGLRARACSSSLKVSSNNHISTSLHQHIKPSAHQHIKPSAHQHISPSAHQHIKPSAHQPISTSPSFVPVT